MKVREMLIAATALVAIGLTSFLAYRYERAPDTNRCAFCQRIVAPATAYRLRVGDRVQTACCPRCALHYTLNHPGVVREAHATDFDSGEALPAESAYYVEGGDVEYCTHGAQPVEREPQGVSVRAYDRCLPTLVAFKTQEHAVTYRKQHGGRVLDYAQAVESVKER
jgi:hypothetical protein